MAEIRIERKARPSRWPLVLVVLVLLAGLAYWILQPRTLASVRAGADSTRTVGVDSARAGTGTGR